MGSTGRAQVPGETAGLDAAGPACRLRGVGKRFAGAWAVRGVDLEVYAGEVHAVMGENGAGKSTLMKLLHGVHRPDEGAVEIGGSPVTLGSAREAEAAGVAMVPQELDLFPELSVVENLFVGRTRPRGRWGGFDRKAMRRQAQAALDRLGAKIDVDAPARTLSSAQGQLIEIARALMHEARVVIFDEPTAALTEHEAQRLFVIIAELRARGVGVLYISHRLDEVFQIADRITVLRDGERIHTGPASTIDADALIRMMVGRPLSKLYVRTAYPPGEVRLEVRGLGRRGSFHDVSFALRAGEIVGLCGLIGAGRSQVAQAVFGVVPADTGEIRIDGRPVVIRNAAAGASHRIAYVPEERRAQGLALEYSVAWNTGLAGLDKLSTAGVVSGARERAAAERFREVFAIRMTDVDAPVGALSGGAQQKVLLAKSLVTEPDVILLDEPTRGVDIGAKAEIYRIVDGLAQAGKAVLLISSELNEVLSLCDRVLVMHEGEIAAHFQGPDYDPAAIGAAAAGLVHAEARP